MTSFQFLPRKVTNRNARTTGSIGSKSTANSRPASNVTNTVTVPELSQPVPSPSQSSPSVYSDEDFVTLLLLSLSEHALNADVDLRRNIDQAEDNFLPLKNLIKRSHVLADHAVPSEVVLVRALRAKPHSALEVRLRVNSDPASGIYEIRRTNATPIQGGWAKDAGAHEVYVENIPPAYRTIPRLARFLTALVPNATSSAPFPVQALALPPLPHARNNTEKRAPAATRGFALATLTTPALCNALLDAWPWERNLSKHIGESEVNDARSDATRFGFRSLAKKSWDARNVEYNTWRVVLVSELVESSGERHAGNAQKQLEDGEEQCEEWYGLDEDQATNVEGEEEPKYPRRCVIFARCLETTTNKTALRALFSEPLGGAGVDYIDYTKGTDCCYVRLANSHLATTLCAHFLDRGKDKGGPDVELIEGRKEAVYWENIPDHVLRDALSRAQSGINGNVTDTTQKGDRKRKRGKAS